MFNYKTAIMKKVLLLTLVLGFSFSLFAQKSHVSKDLREMAVEMTKEGEIVNGIDLRNEVTPPSYKFLVDETELGTSVYDVQSNSAIENRFYRHPDGTMAAVWTMGFDDPSFPGRGTGYAYFDGTSWDANPTERIEDERVGWPSYAPWGPNGEIVAAHTGGSGVKFSKRETKGSGDWTYSTFAGPEEVPGLTWPRICTSGEDNNTLHVIANSYDPYEGQETAILYSRSLDGGETWEDENIIMEGTGSEYYESISADSYIWASRGDVVALIVVPLWYEHDLFMMKSEDNGETWEKTVIWENPFNLTAYADVVTEDTLAAPDGSAGAVIDSQGNVHVTFNLVRAYKEETGSTATFTSFPFHEGIVYWNETMEPFINEENQYDALYYDNLVENETLIGWVPDVDGDGTIDITIDQLFTYIYSATLQPTMTIDSDDNIFVAYSTPREDLGDPLRYHHIFARAKYNGYWVGDPNNIDLDLTNDPLHSFDECIYPQMANMLPGDDKIYLFYARDNEPGEAVGAEPDHEYVTNYYTLIEASHEDFGIYVDIENIENAAAHSVSQNYPNPFSGSANVDVELAEDADLSMEVVNLVGQTVQRVDKGFVKAGTHTLQINGTDLETGVYFYNVNINDETITKKMVIR